MITMLVKSQLESRAWGWAVAVAFALGLVLGAALCRSQTVGNWIESASEWVGGSSQPVIQRPELGPVKRAQLFRRLRPAP
jgi:hypothetical protein